MDFEIVVRDALYACVLSELNNGHIFLAITQNALGLVTIEILHTTSADRLRNLNYSKYIQAATTINLVDYARIINTEWEMEDCDPISYIEDREVKGIVVQFYSKDVFINNEKRELICKGLTIF